MKKLYNKYCNLSSPAIASFWFILTSILQKGISFITVPLFTRLLSPDEYGIINIYQSWLSILTTLLTLTLWGGVFNNGMVKYADDRESFTSSLQGLGTVITLGFLVIFIAFSNHFSTYFNLPINVILLMIIQIMFLPALNLWSAKQRFDYKYKKIVFTTVLISLANPILGIFLILIFNDRGVARIYSIAFVQIIIGLVFYFNNFKISKRFYDKKYWKYALFFNLPLIPHYLSQTILNQADRIMIDRLVGTEEVGIYSVAYSVGMIFFFVVVSINSTFTPWVYKKLKEQLYESIEKTSYLLLIGVSILVFLLISLAPEIIKIMAPPQYSEAIWIIPPVALSIYFIFLYGLFANIEFYFEENKFIMIGSVVAALLNIILNLFMIPIFGYIASGYTTLISYIIYSFAHYIFMRKVLSKNKIEDTLYSFNKIFLLTIILILSSSLIVLTYRIYLYRYLIIIFLGTTLLIKYKEIINRLKTLKT